MLHIDGQRLSHDDACLAGIRYYQQKELNDAVRVFRQVLAVDPFHARTLNALALIESEQGDYCAAEKMLDILLGAHPGYEKGYNSRGLLSLKLKKFDAAENDFIKATELNPDFAEAYGNLGNIHLLLRKLSSAEDCFNKVLQVYPDLPQAYCGLADAQILQGLYDKAAANVEKALCVNNSFAPAYHSKGELLSVQRLFPEAISAYETAISLKPDAALYYRSLANVYQNSSDLSRALKSIQESLRLDASDPLAEYTLGNIYWETGCFFEAAAAYQRGLHLARLSTNLVLLRCGLGGVYSSLGEPLKAIAEFRSCLEFDPANLSIHSNLLLNMYYCSEISNDEIYRESIKLGNIFSGEQLSSVAAQSNSPLKIGFVSADFKTHSVSYFLEPLLAHLDRKRFKIYCYSGVCQPDATTEKFKALADCWIDCTTIPDDLLAATIRAEQIDILVDLSGHTGGHRLAVFAKRPAPIQISWLGYPGTTGFKAVDYRITDSVADPVGMTDNQHSEKLVRIPECFICYRPPADFPSILPPPVLEKNYVTFGSFNNLSKISSAVLATWSKIMRALPDSVLILKSKTFGNDLYIKHWQKILAVHCLDLDRVRLLPYESSKWNHFARYSEIDIALDTFPYNGTTTTCETLWMGVPVIAVAGDRHAARVSASILTCLGLSELVADSPEEYAQKAIELAVDIERLLAYRNEMRRRILASSLCDAAGFAKRWEDAVFKLPGIMQ